MIGEAFDVYDIDEHGCAWVEKWWGEPGEHRINHSVGLNSNEMEIL